MKLLILVEMIHLQCLVHLLFLFGLIRTLLKGIVTAVAQEAPVVNQAPHLRVCAVTNYDALFSCFLLFCFSCSSSCESSIRRHKSLAYVCEVILDSNIILKLGVTYGLTSSVCSELKTSMLSSYVWNYGLSDYY